MWTPVGLDLSLTSTGYACGEQRMAISTNLRGPARLDAIIQQIQCYLLSPSLINALVLIEGYSFASRNSQAHSIGELGGVVRLTLWRLGIPYIEIAPTVRAKFATGKGNASKNEVMSAVSARTGIAWVGKGADDICDAYILEEIGLFKQGNPRHDWPASSAEALKKIDWTALDLTYQTE